MKTPSFNISASAISGAVLMISSVLVGPFAWAQPSNRPLLSNQSGAKPNLMIALDNSGSMAYPFDEAYGLLYSDNVNHNLRYCAGPRTFARTASGDVLNGRVDPAQPNNFRCFQANAVLPNGQPDWSQGAAWSTSNPNGTSYTPALTVQNNSFAQRSADANPVYYNPRTTYEPRIDANYQPVARKANLRFISNGNSHNTSNAFYSVYRNPNGGALYAVHVQKPAPPQPAWYANNLRVYSLGTATPFPVHTEFNATNGTTSTFTYTYCRDSAGASTLVRDPAGLTIGCSSVRATPFSSSNSGSVVTVFHPGSPNAGTNTITLAPDHQRTDCAANNGTCTNAEEVNNILNWYEWYSTRQLATSTAIGQALSGADYQNQLRVGYLPINDYTMAGDPGTNLAITKNPAVAAPGTATGDVNVLRGVRTLQGGTTASTELYGFLNNIQSRGGTPLHNAVNQVGNYYTVPSGSVENPWSSNPAAVSNATSNPEMSCRRSFNLLFSDGGWTQAYAPAAGPNYDNQNGATFSQTLADGSTNTFSYRPTGDNSAAGRIQYTPYPSSGIGGLADLTARYFWNTDFRPLLANQIQTRAGQPAFWQNMATYTVGYMVSPTAEVAGGAGLSFSRIEDYQRQYLQSGYAAATKPDWPTGDLTVNSTNQQRVDDFIHAGYTGGGRAYSARTSDDVRRIFEAIFADILSASGRDAGVSVSSTGGDGSTLDQSLKFSVTYRTLDNSGNIYAFELDSNGNTAVPPSIRWSANDLMQPASARNVFTMSGTNQPISFSGAFSGLPTDVQNALSTGPDASRIPSDDRFINYLRGDNSQTDAFNRLFRQRPVNANSAATLSSMVNPPSNLMNYSRDYRYDEIESGGGVDGWDSYNTFAGRKVGYDYYKLSQLFVATNAGTMHSFNADGDDPPPTGQEFKRAGMERAAFKPRRSLRRMLNFARDPYNFEYVLDGPISQNDIFDRPLADRNGWTTPAAQSRAWRHVGIGTGGRGEQLIYAIESPFTAGASPSRAPGRDNFLWETGPDLINSASNGDVVVGYMTNPARSGQTEAPGTEQNSEIGDWVVVVNNGHYNGESNGRKAGLVVLNALTGAVIKNIPLPNGYSAGRGLSGVTLLRNYGLHDRVVAAYAGDANGQLWRFNLTGNPSDWGVVNNRPLFTVPDNRPIFGAPAWQPHDLDSDSDGYMVVIATGMMLEENDLDDLGPQAIYGIWDRMNADGSMVASTGPSSSWQVDASQLQEQRVLPGATAAGFTNLFAITDNVINWQTQRGWYMPMENLGQSDASLRPGERSIAEVINVGNKVVVTTTELRRPASTEMCSASDLPGNYVYFLDARTASASDSKSFDGDGDSLPDRFAVAYIPSGGFSRGVAVVTRRIRSDGTDLTVDSLPPPEDIGDPYIDPLETTRPMGVGLDGEYREEKKSCVSIRATFLGTESNALVGASICPVTGWTRTQYQLSTPPTN